MRRFIYVSCDCGRHLVDLSNFINNTAIYHCNDCLKSLVIKGEDGHFYLVGPLISRGEEVKT